MVEILDYVKSSDMPSHQNASENHFISIFPTNSPKVNFVDDVLDDGDYEKIESITEKIKNLISKRYCSLISQEFGNISLFSLSSMEGSEIIRKGLRLQFAVTKISKGEIKILSQDKDYQVLFGNLEYSEIQNNSTKKILNWKYITVKFWLIVSFFFKRRKKKILWLGGKNAYTRLLGILRKKFSFFVLQGTISTIYDFTRLQVPYRTLPISKLTQSELDTLKQEYEDLKKSLIAFDDILPAKYILYAYKISLENYTELYHTYISIINNHQFIDLIYTEQSVKDHALLTLILSKKLNIPSIELLHGVPMSIEVGETTVAGVYGKRDFEYLLQNGVPAEKMKIVGCPRYKMFFDHKRKEKSEFQGEYFLFAMDPVRYDEAQKSEKENSVIVDGLLNAFSNTDKILYIKLHPRQSLIEKEFIQNSIDNFGLSNQVFLKDTNSNLFRLMQKCTAVLTHSSSVGVEALLMNIRAIGLDFIPGRKVHFEKYGIGLGAKTPAELAALLEDESLFSYEHFQSNQEAFEKTSRYFCGMNPSETIEIVEKICTELTE